MRAEIQGLRAIAIVSVLLFHVWSDEFKVGYLGVDIFFVLSGYLMLMLLSRKTTINTSDSIDFYFRRIKRIVPAYLFVVFLTISACYFVVSEFDFGQIVNEAIPSLFFYSNFPSVHETAYFDTKSQYLFFLHTWSLSVELQFYLFVPLLVFILGYLSKIHFILSPLLILTISSISFYQQLTSTSNAKHMILNARIWQFLCGFLAYLIYKSKVLDFKQEKREKINNRQIFNIYHVNVLQKIFAFSCITLPICLLCTLLLFGLFPAWDFQLQRLTVVFLTALILSIHSGWYWFLEWNQLISIGDISYSVYLIHWPILVMHKYVQPDLYEDEKEANYIVGTFLVGISFSLGYWMETVFKKWLQHVKTWKSLVHLICIFYLISGIGLLYLNRDSIALIDNKVLTKAGEERRLRDTLMLWKTRNNNTVLSRNRIMALNLEIAYSKEICNNKTHLLPSNFTDLSSIEKICHETGNGQKHIIVFGNSHAYKSFIGISQIFKAIAHKITLMSTPACVPAYLKHQDPGLVFDKQENCVKFVQDGVRILKAYTQSIDIIIPLFGYNKFKKDFPKEEMPELLEAMQSFYGNMSKIAKDAVFVPMMHVLFTKNPLKSIQYMLRKNKTIKTIGDPKLKVASYLPNTRKQLEKIKCRNCIKINWIDLWCKRGKNGFCHAVDPRRHLSYFLDNHHCTTYGSMFIADFMFKAYINHTNKG